MRLGLLMCLTILLRWPDWHMTTLYVKGFQVAGDIPLSNVYGLPAHFQDTGVLPMGHLLVP